MFHCKDGLFFEKTPEGDVHIMVKDEFSHTVFETTVGCSSMASVMAAVCSRGYSSETFFVAYEFLKQPPTKEQQ